MRTICFCNSNIPWGGGEKWHLDAAVALASRGWRVLFLCHPHGELFKRASALPALRVRGLALGRLSFCNPLVRIRLERLFRAEAVDTLIMNLPADLKAAAPAAKAAGVRRIIYRRGSALPVRDSWLNRRLYGRVITRLIVNSEATRRLVLINNSALIPENRISILPNGLDVRAFDQALSTAISAGETLRPKPEHPPAAAPENRRQRPFILGNAGRLTRQKGQHLLLHLCRRLLDAGLDCALIIAGTGEREEELKNLAIALGIGDRVIFPGFMEDLAPFWQAVDLFVLSSLWEGFGTVLIEAMLARKPVFAFAVSNIPELVHEDGPDSPGNGRLFPLPAEERPYCPEPVPDEAMAKNSDGETTGTKDVSEEKPYASLDALAQAVIELAADPTAGKRMGEAGRALALRFSQEACMDALEKILEQS